MTYLVDFDRSYDQGDYRFRLRRQNGHTTATKVQLYRPGIVDIGDREVEVPPDDLPIDIRADYTTLVRGSLPATNETV